MEGFIKFRRKDQFFMSFAASKLPVTETFNLEPGIMNLETFWSHKVFVVFSKIVREVPE